MLKSLLKGHLTTKLVFFCIPSYFSGVHQFFGEIICVCDHFFNPTIEVVTFRLHGWCMLGMFFVAGIHPSGTWMSGSFKSVWWSANVHRLDLRLYSHPKQFFEGMESEPMLTPREKSPLQEAQRRIKPPTLHHAGQQTQHIYDWVIPGVWHHKVSVPKLAEGCGTKCPMACWRGMAPPG